MDREFHAVIDGTLGGPDAIFESMESYLRELKITTADKVPFVADGARRIWNRVGTLLRGLGVEAEQVDELVDFYHPVEHLGQIAALKSRWTAAERRAWIGHQRRRLLKGEIEEVRAATEAVCGSRSGKVNLKRVHRLWIELGLKRPMRRKKPRKLGAKLGVEGDSCVRKPSRFKNDVWTCDFIRDRTAGGRSLKWLTLVDESTRDCLVLHAAGSMTGADARRIMARVVGRRGGFGAATGRSSSARP